MRLPVHSLGLAVVMLALGASPAAAQDPPRTRIYYGTRLVEAEPEPVVQPEPVPIPRLAEPPPLPPRVEPERERTSPVIVNVAPPVGGQAADPTTDRRLKQLEREADDLRRRLDEQSAVRRVSAEQPARLPELPPAEPREPAAPVTMKVETAPGGQPTFTTVVLTQMAAIVGSIVVLMVLFFGTHLLLARRGGGLGSLFRVELVGAGSMGPGERFAEAEVVPPEPMPEPWGEVEPNFEIGPTFEEEKARREEAERNKEKAVLQQIFELNKQMQDEIRGQQPAAAAS